nr:MAG TPA: L SHAPED TAIL FIBER PROTEIN [Caudoviricetes sp.]
MAIVIKKLEGSLPVSRQKYTEGTTYYKGNIVTHFGSAFQCVAESTTTPPATLDESGSVVLGEGWIFFADASAARNVNTRINGLSEDYMAGVAISTPKAVPFELIKGGYLANGKLEKSSTASYTNFIKVDSNKLYRVVSILYYIGADYVCFYEESNFDKPVAWLKPNSASTPMDDLISVPRGANYMVVCTFESQIISVEEMCKDRAASVTTESEVNYMSLFNELVLKGLVKRTNNIYNAFQNNLSPLHFYVNSQFVLSTNQLGIFTHFIKIGRSKKGVYYNFKIFSEQDFSGILYDCYLSLIDNLASGEKISSSGSSNLANKRGYMPSDKESELYLVVVFDTVADNISKAREVLRLISENLVVTETATPAYPTAYEPYYNLGLSLKISDETNLYIIDSDGNLVGNKIKFGYVEPPTSDVVDSKYLNSVKDIKFKLEGNSAKEAVVVGDGWSGNLSNGYSHVAGKTEALEFDLSQYSIGDKFLLRFNCEGIISESTDILVSVGDAPAVKTYNGGSAFVLGFIATGGNLKIVPLSAFSSTITDISICKISNNGQEELSLSVDNVYAQVNDFITAFWNVAIGAKDNTLNKLVNGSRNIAIGNYALKSIASGNRNVAIGTFALPEVTEAENNVAVGSDTIYPLKKAMNCIGIGKGTLGGSLSAEDCVAVGIGAMGVYILNKHRTKCVAVGSLSGPKITDSCTHVGYRAGANVAGARNTSVGYNSLAVGNTQTVDIIGTDLTCVGSMAQVANTDTAKAATNSTAIGANTIITKSNQIVIGNSQVEEVILGGKKITFNADGTCTWEAV